MDHLKKKLVQEILILFVVVGKVKINPIAMVPIKERGSDQQCTILLNLKLSFSVVVQNLLLTLYVMEATPDNIILDINNPLKSPVIYRAFY